MKRKWISLALFFISASSSSQDLAVFVKNHGDFEVLYSRAQSTAVGAVFGGLIGAAIEEGVRSSSDTEKENQILEHLTSSNCSDTLLENLVTKLNANAQSTTILEQGKSTRDYPSVLTLNIKNCGFKIVDSSTQKVASFAELEVELSLDGKDQKDFEENYYMTSRNHYYWDELMASPEIIQEEFLIALQRIGNRVANKYIYRK